ncbi:MAG: acetoacetate decarboxylase family protein [Gemmatimonadota bacterium]
MEYTYYGFQNCVGAFFEMPTADARGLLPRHLQPMEMQHTRSILSVMAFQFTESTVGAYDELVMAIIVPPMVEPDRPLPKAAFYPFMVATSTEAARLHAIDRWHLPHLMKDVTMDFDEDGDTMDVRVRDEDGPILDLMVTQHEYRPSKNMYSAFTVDGDARFKANIYMEGPHSEHEEENGSLTLYRHAMTEGLTIDDIATYPFREQWYQAGLQTFEPLESI